MNNKYNLTIPQKSILLMEQYYSNTNINNICGTASIKESVDFNNLEKAVNIVLKNNDSLRTQLHKNGTTYSQSIKEYTYQKLDIVDVNSEDDLKALENNMSRKIFIIDQKLVDIKLFRFPNNYGGFVINVHHIISDAWTLGLFSRRVMEAYEAVSNNEDIPYNENYSYTNYINSENDYLSSKKFLQDKEYWNSKFEDIPLPITLPTTTKTSDEFSCIAEREVFYISEKQLNSINEYCRERKISLFNFFTAIVSIYLSKINNSTDFVLGTPILNRSNFNEKNTMGMFINTIPLRINIDKTSNFETLSKSIASNSLNALRHQRYPYESLLSDLRKKDSNIPNLYNILISYQITKANNTTSYNYSTTWNFNGSTTDDLTIQFYDLDESNELTVAYDYKKLKYTKEFISDMHSRINSIINQVIKEPEISIENIEAITEKEFNKINNTFNNTHFDYDKSETVISNFYKISKENSSKTAIICNNTEITYKELNEKSNILARHLIKQGIKDKQVIGIMLNRSIEMAIGLLAILKAGATYLPIDPSYPVERITYMLENSDSSLLLVNNSTENLIDFNNKINISLENEFYNKYSTDNLDKKIDSKNLIYLIYTSGSTGKPKGVMLTHQNIVNFLYGMKQVIDFNKNKVMTSVTTICFDIFVLEFWGALTSGMTLVLANEEEQNDSIKLNELCLKTKANIIQTTPSRYSAFLQNKDHLEFLQKMSDILVGGEAFPDALLSKLREITKASIFNMYGPTETAVWSTVKKINKNITVGTPITNTTCYILNNDKQLMPPYIPGELYIGGDGVSNGYYKRDELTQEKFIKSPFKDNEIIYNTGDLAYFNQNGEIIHLGRTDFQIKLRGYRIELGEIENKILNIPSITHCIVIPNENNTYLICYYTSSAEISTNTITEILLSELPNYMIPSYFHRLDALPLTPNGKLDRKKLPKIELTNTITETYSTDTEQKISKIICETLDLQEVDINTPFLTLGLDSLDLIQIQTKLIKYNYILNTQDLFKFNTIKSLAEHIDNNINFYNDDDIQIPIEYRHKSDEILACINESTLSDKYLGNVFLTGANGFIGIHLLHELLTTTNVNIYCLVRGNNIVHATERLTKTYDFYFDENISNIINSRVFILNGSINKDNIGLSNKSLNLIKNNVSTIIHTAAIVKHYGNFEEFQDVNIKGTKNIASLALSMNKRLIHLSSISVSGNYLVKQNNRNINFSENDLYIGQHYTDNVYVHSKFEAEKVIIEYMKKGLNAQIQRIGILSGRLSDGKFQKNIQENAFYNRIKSIILLSSVSETMLDNKIEFTPIDSCVRSIIRLAKNKIADNKIYHLFNHNLTTIKDILDVLKKFDINVNILKPDEFQNKILESSNNKNSSSLNGIINDLNITSESQMSINYNFSVNIKSDYTQKYLRLLKCDWNACDKAYLTKIISYMKKVNFI